jgi:hypothetical protein
MLDRFDAVVLPLTFIVITAYTSKRKALVKFNMQKYGSKGLHADIGSLKGSELIEG